DECAIPRPTGSQLLAGRNKKVSDEIIGKIHGAYPELNIVWLMFGEGNMLTNANIETSEPQTEQEVDNYIEKPATNQPIDFTIDFHENLHNETEEKGQVSTSVNTFTFASPAETISDGQSEEIPQEEEKPSGSFTVTPGTGRRVTGIVVYYDDCTYESFIPDPNHSNPFIR
ncbi:MAG: hypothetical protein K2J28_10505, partial [Duncaniella sp.]|nr:hypothetical protein [Duncaniella sp.]